MRRAKIDKRGYAAAVNLIAEGKAASTNNADNDSGSNRPNGHGSIGLTSIQTRNPSTSTGPPISDGSSNDENSNGNSIESTPTTKIEPPGLVTMVLGKIDPNTPFKLYKRSSELEAILNVMVINDQKTHFMTEYEQLQRGKDVDPTSTLYDLSPFMEDGVIKMRTRLTRMDILPEQLKHPTILARDSKLSELLIMDSHVRQIHAGPEQAKRMVRNKFWIIGGKRVISTVINKCLHRPCVLKRLKPVIQTAPPLPPERIGDYNSVWQYTSLDACGPFHLKKCGS